MYFIDIGPDLSNQISQTNDKVDDLMEPVSGLFNFKHISVQEGTKALKMLDASKSCGPDMTPGSILKDSSEVTAMYLTYIDNCSLSSGIFPDDWKKARVSPIFKAGDKDECGNYRPISVS